MNTHRLFLFLTAAWLGLAATAWAQGLQTPPAAAHAHVLLAERGHPDKTGKRPERDERPAVVVTPPMAGGIVFSPAQQQVARSFYLQPEYRGFVPPGLAKKGGLPPGQAKRWRIGQPLPAGVVYYTLPGPLLVSLGPPPAGHRYVRVATDILLIAIGTGLVVDAIEDIVR